MTRRRLIRLLAAAAPAALCACGRKGPPEKPASPDGDSDDNGRRDG